MFGPRLFWYDLDMSPCHDFESIFPSTANMTKIALKSLKYLLFVSDVRGQGLFFGPLHEPLVLVCGSKILVT